MAPSSWMVTVFLLLVVTPPVAGQRLDPAGVAREARAMPPQPRAQSREALDRRASVPGTEALRPWDADDFWRWTAVGAATGAAVCAVATVVALLSSRNEELFTPPVLLVGIGAAYCGGAGGVAGALAYVFTRSYGEKRPWEPLHRRPTTPR